MKTFQLLILSALLLFSGNSRGAYPDVFLSPQQVLRVYDGDTFYITVAYWPTVIGEDIGIRVLGINTPEMRSSCSTLADKEAEKQLANQARALLEEQLLTAKIIQLSNISRDKFFRLDATVLVDGVDVTQRLIDAGLAMPYDGKTTKPSWCGLEYFQF